MKLKKCFGRIAAMFLVLVMGLGATPMFGVTAVASSGCPSCFVFDSSVLVGNRWEQWANMVWPQVQGRPALENALTDYMEAILEQHRDVIITDSWILGQIVGNTIGDFLDTFPRPGVGRGAGVMLNIINSFSASGFSAHFTFAFCEICPARTIDFPSGGVGGVVLYASPGLLANVFGVAVGSAPGGGGVVFGLDSGDDVVITASQQMHGRGALYVRDGATLMMVRAFAYMIDADVHVHMPSGVHTITGQHRVSDTTVTLVLQGGNPTATINGMMVDIATFQGIPILAGEIVPLYANAISPPTAPRTPFMQARVFSDFTGATVSNLGGGSVTATMNDNNGDPVTVVINADSATATVNGATVDIATYMSNPSFPTDSIQGTINRYGRIYVPLYFLANAFGMRVSYQRVGNQYQVRLEGHNGAWHTFTDVTEMNDALAIIMYPEIVEPPAEFFYKINFAAETLNFGRTFYYAELDAARNISRDNNGAAIMSRANRSEITLIFNRRADRIRIDRGNWQPTLSGEVNISRHLNRGGYIGVRRNIARGQYELIAVIEIPARASHRGIRQARREIYMPSRVNADGTYQAGQFLQNPTDVAIEIRIGDDRGIFNGSRPPIATEFLAPNATFAFPHDALPRGTRGAFRVAPVEQNNFVMFDGEYTCVRYLLLRGITQIGGVPLELGEGNFGSALVRFRIPNRPNAPATARMTMTEGRNGEPWFISRTNANMRVKLGYDGTTPVWGNLSQNTTLPALVELFAEGGFALPTPEYVTINGERTLHRVFEIRIFRANRIVSAPGFLALCADAFTANQAVRASVSPVNVVGTQYSANTVISRPAGVNVLIITTGGRATVAVGNDVTSWFTNLPDGIAATVRSLAGNSSRITVNLQGIPTEAMANVPMEIAIPASALTGGTLPQGVDATVEVTRSEDRQGNAARFNIAAGTAPATTPATPNAAMIDAPVSDTTTPDALTTP